MVVLVDEEEEERVQSTVRTHSGWEDIELLVHTVIHHNTILVTIHQKVHKPYYENTVCLYINSVGND